MGKTTQVLIIHVADAWVNRPEIKALEAKGHTIVPLGLDIPASDLILAPEAWQWNDTLWEMIDVPIKAARARKYPRKPRTHAKGGTVASSSEGLEGAADE